MVDKSLAGINKLIHEPARLKIMAQLYVIESADFLFLMRQIGLTFGNLSAHLSKLEAAGYIEIEKESPEIDEYLKMISRFENKVKQDEIKKEDLDKVLMALEEKILSLDDQQKIKLKRQ